MHETNCNPNEFVEEETNFCVVQVDRTQTVKSVENI